MTTRPEDSVAPEPEAQEAPDAGERPGGMTGLRRITLIVACTALGLLTYYVAADRTTPFAADARVQAFVLRVAPEVGGRVARIAVTDNGVVEPGEELFAIDPIPFELAVAQAEARLDRAGQAIGASTAAVEAAQARLNEARAREANVGAQAGRTLEVAQRGVYPQARQDEALAAIEEARSAVQLAEAGLRQAQEELSPAGADNPQMREALAALDRARFDLSRTSLTAPARGVVTNLQLTSGQTVNAGQPVMTFISSEDVWLLAAMRENSLEVLEPGQRAEVVLDSLPGRVFPATVRSIGWGVAGGMVDPQTGLPDTSGGSGWLGNPQRFPVHLVFDRERLPAGVRYGSKAAVIVYARESRIMQALARLRIRLISILTYVS
jgi:multidrug resistance efflux pump